MKRRIMVTCVLLLILILTISACSSGPKTAQIKYIGGSSDSVNAMTGNAGGSEFEPWSAKNTAFHTNVKAPEIVSVTINGKEYRGKYTGYSYVSIPNVYTTDEYKSTEDSLPFMHFFINGMGELCEFMAKPSKDIGTEKVSKDEARVIADEIASQYIDLSDYQVNLVEKSMYSFTYHKKIGDIESRSGIEITIGKSGEFFHYVNYITKDFDDWYKNSTQKEKEDFLQACTSNEIQEELKGKLAATLKCDPSEMECAIEYQTIIMAGKNKPAIYSIVNVAVSPKDSSKQRYSELLDVLVVYE